MRRVSEKRRKRIAEVAPFREAFKIEVGRCERCGCRRHLDVHEIARGSGHRAKALDKRYAVLCLCRQCHDQMDGWSRAKQLALLMIRRPYDWDLDSYHALIGRVFPDIGSVLECVELVMEEIP